MATARSTLPRRLHPLSWLAVPLRVAFDTAPLLLNRTGEARYARQLLTALAARDDVAVRPVGLGRRVPTTLAQRVALQAGVQGLYYPLVQPWQARGADVMHLPRHLVPPQPGLRAPTLVTIHDVLPLRAPELFSPVIRANFRLLAPALARRADRIVAGSQYTKGEIVELLDIDPQRVTVTPYGVDERFRPGGAVPARLGLDRPYVACVGTLEPRKNVAAAVRAFAALGDDSLALVVIGGRGWDGGELETAARAAPGRVVLTGYVSDEELVGLLGGAACFVYPSLYEGFGFPVLEAMACGTPVVASERASLPEVAGDAALLVDPEDVDALAGALRRVLGDPALAADLRARGRRRAALYTWRRCADATVCVYQELAA